MTTPVNGPGDVAPGDIVEVSKSYNKPGKTGLATVVKATSTMLTVRWPDGTKTTRAYTRTDPPDRFSYSSRATTSRNFDRLSAHDRWSRLGRPKFTDAVVVSVTAHGHGRSFGASADAIRDRLPDVVAQLEVIAAWLKAEPAKDAP